MTASDEEYEKVAAAYHKELVAAGPDFQEFLMKEYNNSMNSDSDGIWCPHCGTYNTHEECGTYEVMFPSCKNCGECTEVFDD